MKKQKKETSEEKARRIYAAQKAKIKNTQIRQDIEEFLDAGEWALALELLEDKLIYKN